MTRICKDPNLPSARAIRKRFPTPATLAAASLDDLHAMRLGKRPSSAGLLTLHLLAADSIGVRSEGRVHGLVIEQDQLIEAVEVFTRQLERLEAELTLVVTASREGRIVTPSRASERFLR